LQSPRFVLAWCFTASIALSACQPTTPSAPPPPPAGPTSTTGGAAAPTTKPALGIDLRVPPTRVPRPSPSTVRPVVSPSPSAESRSRSMLIGALTLAAARALRSRSRRSRRPRSNARRRRPCRATRSARRQATSEVATAYTTSGRCTRAYPSAARSMHPEPRLADVGQPRTELIAEHPEGLWGRETPRSVRLLARRRGADRRAQAVIAPAPRLRAVLASVSRDVVPGGVAPRCSTRQTPRVPTGGAARRG
jgi:hypothetical protein